MHIKRFEGTTMREVLREVREELGPDALVVSTRTTRRDQGWLGRFGRPIVEVTAAVDRPPRPATHENGVGRVEPDPSWKDMRLARALMNPLEAEMASLRNAVDRLAEQAAAPQRGLLADEIAQLRAISADLAGSRGTPAHLPEAHGDAYLAAGLETRHAASLSAEASELTREGEDERGDPLVEALARRLDAKLAPPRSDEHPISLYVGPPGVGKTTTLAKLAARDASLDEGMVLLSTDVHRAGGEAMLRAYAEQLQMPFATAVSPQSLARSISRLGGQRVLVDTAGRSRADQAAIPQLKRLRDALGEKARVCLVLPATTKESELRADLGRYRTLEPDSMVLTKVDESCDLGNVANLLLDGACPPLSWITSGQRVPADLEVADPTQLAGRILGVPA